MKKIFLTATAIFAAVSMCSCSGGTNATDYSKDENWLIKKYNQQNRYDLVFFFGTAINEPTHENGVGDISDEMRQSGLTNYETVGRQLSFVKSNANNIYAANVFVPLQRQMALNYGLEYYVSHEDLINDIKKYEPAIDIKAAMDYYFTNFNKNAERPFILAGHSQGGASTQVILEEYFIKGGHKSYLKNMIAMYSVGYGVSKKWFEGLDKKVDGKDVVHLGDGATDTNCVLCWNTEGEGGGEGNGLLSDEKYDTYCINPLNWKTDSTYASKDENLGVLIDNPNYDPEDPYSPKKTISTKEEDKFDAYINLERGSVISSEPNSGTYVYIPPYGAVFGGKSLHCSDGPGFYVNMSRNLGDRLDTWFKK